MIPDAPLVARFKNDLDAMVAPAEKVGIAVSGGPDSLALLLLAAAARPGLVEAATVDHRIRSESHKEAQVVAALCEQIGVPHASLAAQWGRPPSSNIQARARDERYRLLGEWAVSRTIEAFATAHQTDDQAETFLMRAARGAGVAGMGCILPVRSFPVSGKTVRLVRPLLEWQRTELATIVEAAGLTSVEDPANHDDRFDRSRARALLRDHPWLDPFRLAAVAAHCRDAEDALNWTMAKELAQRRTVRGKELTLDPSGLPRELQRRLLVAAIGELAGVECAGPQVMTAIDQLDAGGTTTLAGLKLVGGTVWRLSPAPPRRSKMFTPS